MRHAFISFGEYDILNQYDITFSSLPDDEAESFQKTWNETMTQRGFDLSIDKDAITAIFKLICKEFSKNFGEKIEISLREGYITKKESHKPINHSQASRVFSMTNTVYLDYLISSVLYDYTTIYYIWARHQDNASIATSCFKQALYIFDGCCRKGLLTNKEGSLNLLQLMRNILEDHEFKIISDLYWCMIAFALCHEVAHIYLHHFTEGDNETAYIQEFQADHVGYDIFLKIMLKTKDNTADTVDNVFRDYMYAAPMILLLFYHNLFTTGYWLFGEQILTLHPNPIDRINKLLEISQESKYDFDTRDGNIILGGYWDITDCYLEELWYKLQRGKLRTIIQKGGNSMTNRNSFNEAFALDDEICKRIKLFAAESGYEEQKCLGLWNVTGYLSSDSLGDYKGFVYSVGEKSVTTKPMNIVYKQKVLLGFIIESGLTLTKPENKVETIKAALYILYKLALMSTIEITDTQAAVLKYLHTHQAYTQPISEEEILQNVKDANSGTVTILDQMKCIEIVDGIVYLRERVIFPLIH